MSSEKGLGLHPPNDGKSGAPVQTPSGPATDEEASAASRLRGLIVGPPGRYLLVGGVSFSVDFFLLIFLHEYFGVQLWLATPVAFLTSLVVNYLLSRFFTFAGTGARGASFVKYIALVVFNTIATSLIVSGFEAMGGAYMLGKVASTVLMTVWNFFAYKYWVFARKENPGLV